MNEDREAHRLWTATDLIEWSEIPPERGWEAPNCECWPQPGRGLWAKVQAMSFVGFLGLLDPKAFEEKLPLGRVT